MAVEQSDTGFGRVSRVRGVLFEYLAFGASVAGILALSALLVYVVVDAFDLAGVDPLWLLTYGLTLVVPYIAFCLVAVDDRAFAVRTVRVLVGGLVGTAVCFTAFEALVRPIPGITWPLAALFVVVVPTVISLAVATSREPMGRVGFGVIGRLLGGVAFGLALSVLFVVLDDRLWFLAYTLGVLPAVGTLVLGRRRPATESIAPILAVVVGVVGFVVASALREPIATYPTPLFIHLWAFTLPVSGAVAVLVGRRSGRRLGGLAGGVTVALSAVGGLAASALGVASVPAVLVSLTVGATLVTFVLRVHDAPAGRLGVVLPVVLLLGVVAGTVVVRTVGIPAPDPWLDPSFLASPHSRTPTDAGLYPAIVGSVLVIGFVAVLSFVLGVGTAVFLEEYTADSGVVGAITRLIQLNIANLAAVPSVVYGLLGLGLFANLLGLGFGTVVTAGITLSLLILPITIISAQEAIRAVPNDLRRASDGMGATRWQTTKRIVLPEALPGIMTGTILALGRAIGETAPLLMIGAATTVFSPPRDIWSKISAMPMQIYAWADLPQADFRYGVVAAGVVTLLIVLLGMNATAIVIRNRSER